MPGADESLAQRLLAGDRRALARGISLVENDDPEGWALVKEVYPHTGRAAIIGVTGPPGAGKSTLLAALTKLERARERTVAVLSIDPTSPSWARIFERCPIHDQRPSVTFALRPISNLTPGHTKHRPSVWRRPRQRSFSQSQRTAKSA